MVAFGFAKGSVRLTDIEGMDIKTENNGKQLNLLIDVRLRDGKKREFGLRLSLDELETPHPRTKRVSVVFPKKKFLEGRNLGEILSREKIEINVVKIEQNIG